MQHKYIAYFSLMINNIGLQFLQTIDKCTWESLINNGLR